MGYFAQINENNIVEQIIAINNLDLGEPEFTFPETDAIGQVFIANVLKLPGSWKQTSYHNNIRKNYAGIGYTYDLDLDAFIPPQPYASWILNIETCLWDSPIPYPADGTVYTWNEDNQNWEEVE
jgi:hypothetical protein